MAKITPADVQKLRQMTGAGMMAAKNALEEANGELDAAVEVLRRRGEATAAKKSDRATTTGLIDSYVHNGSIGVLVEVGCETDFVARTEDFKQFCHDLAMHVAAHDPEYLNPEAVPADVIERERTRYSDEAKEAGKPADIVEKLVTGKLDKFYEQVCLTRQPFLKDADITVEQLLTQLIAKLGENITIVRYIRYSMGDAS